ncbi:MAG: STAS domain-containing protein [Polyangiaceae bacterium]|nr:STAS domain-containing protein [Polyangiaceae bacterium]
MRCDRCILTDGSGADLPLARFLEDVIACGECPEAAAGPPALRAAVDRLRECGRALRRAESKLRQRENELHEAMEAAARHEARMEVVAQLYRQSTRELEPQLAVVERQAETIRALSAPILEVAEGVVAMPVIGALDRQRAGLITGALLDRIHARETHHAILDLTGLEEVDAGTAMILVRVCAAVRLLGAQVILCGLHGRVARELVELGADLSGMETLPTLKEALRRCR